MGSIGERSTWSELVKRISEELILEKISLYIFSSDFRKKY